MKMTGVKKYSKTMNVLMGVLPPVILIALLVGFWQINCVAGEIPAWKLPKPSDIAVSFVQGFQENLPYLISTYSNILIGFVIAVILGIGLAVLLTNSRILAMALTPIIVVLCCVPMVTLVPLLLVGMGTGPAPKILTVVIQCFPIVNMNACVGFANVDRTRLELMQSMKASRFQTYRFCMFRNAMPDIFTGIKLSSVLAMIAGVSAEICGGAGGLGNQISSLVSFSRTAEAFGCLLYVTIFGLALYGVVGLIEKKLTKGM